MATPLWFGVHRKAVKLVDSASLSVSASVTNGPAHNIRNGSRISGFWVSIEAISGTSATVVVKLQMSFDGGVTWLNTGFATGTLTLAQGVQTVFVAITADLAHLVRCVATLSTSTTPTCTYSAWLGFSSEQGSLPAGE